MPAIYTIEWKDGRKQEIGGHRGYYYVLGNGAVLSFLPIPAWCPGCKQVTLCETLQEAQDTRQELAELNDPGSARSKHLAKTSFSEEFPAHWKKVVETTLCHALERVLPPSCLECGGREVVHFVESKWAPHPGTGEVVKFYASALCSTDFAMRFFDSDCREIFPSREEQRSLMKAKV